MSLNAPKLGEVAMADDKDTQGLSCGLRNNSPVELSGAHDVSPVRYARDSLTDLSDAATTPSMRWNGAATLA